VLAVAKRVVKIMCILNMAYHGRYRIVI
jgi:hypothetical protein